jgi:hypothetical protein
MFCHTFYVLISSYQWNSNLSSQKIAAIIRGIRTRYILVYLVSVIIM